MKLLIFLFLFVPEILFAQIQTINNGIKCIPDALEIIQENSLFSDSINWNVLSTNIQNISSGVETQQCDSIKKYIIQALRNVGDRHSFFISKEKFSQLSSNFDSVKQGEARLLDNKIGYLKIPAFVSLNKSEISNFANNIQNQIENLDNSNNIVAWIVDLRNNSGGNMWPMIGGLNPLIEDGIMGYFVYPKIDREIEWKSEYGNTNTTRLENSYKIKRLSSRIAVLIDSATSSSGEMTAITFIGLSNVKVFGQPSAGFTTANQPFNLSDGSTLFLATSYAANRNHKIFLGKIVPDVYVNTNINSDTDKTIEIAKKWLLEATLQ